MLKVPALTSLAFSGASVGTDLAKAAGGAASFVRKRIESAAVQSTRGVVSFKAYVSQVGEPPPSVTRSGLMRLVSDPRWESLALDASQEVDDEIVFQLAAHTRLKRLGLAWCQAITNEGVIALGQSESIEELDLREVPVDETAASALAKAPRLRRLVVSWPRDFARFQAARPDCRLVHRFAR